MRWSSAMLIAWLYAAACTGSSHRVLERRDASAVHDADEDDSGTSAQPARPFVAPHFVEVAAAAGLDYVQAPEHVDLGCEDLPKNRCFFSSIHMSGGAAAGDV